ncbi:bifunctional oligoribonuclease/PAP phosphatase NrnA [Termitidicoccus mucosus]|uniref:Phosphoesterase n=1 Tax=Termitidicoccus mucosus TaxID=1184151 RepID=A0A178IMR1_9BACT|nr:phosphoesterase [Opitutaceae bacterium TSB47]
MEKLFPDLSSRFARLLADIAGQRIAVVGHARPDGDCIGSQIALARVLRARGHEVVCVNGDLVPRRLRYLVGDMPFYLTDDTPAGDWAAIYVDCADHARGGEKARKRFPAPVAVIDHHLSNSGFAPCNIIDSTSAAACEILAGLFLDNAIDIDPGAARALYAGIVTDTGMFRFNSTTRRTFMLAAELVTRGANPSEAGYEIYERESPAKLRLLQRFLGSLRYECGGRACVGLLPDGVFEQTGAEIEDTEGLVDYARCIDGVDIGVLIEERAGAIKASFRAKNPVFRVDQIAAQFGGGGHACAAGLNLQGGTLADFRPRLVAALAAQFAAMEIKN